MTVLLLIAQTIALGVSIRNRLWKTIPCWFVYICVATVHVLMGLVPMAEGRDYPILLLYFEPVIILSQIAFAFESSVKVLGITLTEGPPEGRLLLWLIPSVPAAIVLPIEIGFIQDAVASWHNQEGESLRLVYAIRLFLSLTLFVVLAVIPTIARLSMRVTRPAAAFHHYAVTGYVALAALGYLCKSYVSFGVDYYATLAFFVFGPVICFLVWSRKMWNRGPSDLEPVEGVTPNDPSTAFQRGAFQS